MDSSLEFLLNYECLIVKESIEDNNNGFINNLLKGPKKQGQFNIYGVNNDLILIGKEYYRNEYFDILNLKKYRPYKIIICALDGSEIIKIKRDKHCGRQGCFCCILCCCAVETCHQDILIYYGNNTCTPGEYIGRVKEQYNWFSPTFTVYDDDNNEQFKIVGNKVKNNSNNRNMLFSSHYEMKIHQTFTSSSGCNVGITRNSVNSGTEDSINPFHSNDGEPVGEISKLYSGIKQNLFNDQNNIYVEFPPKSTIPHKSLLLGSLFLINSLFYNLQSNTTNTTNNNKV